MTTDNAPERLDNPKSPAPDSAEATPAPRRRRWLKVLAGVVIALLLLVLLTPTLLSTSVARSFVVGKINDNLNGRVEIADWKISWTGGVTVTGVRIFDDKNSQIAQVESLSTQLSLVKAIGGDLKLGDTVVRGADFTLIQDPDGSINFAKLAKPSNKPDAPPSDLPDVSGNIRIESSRGMFVRNSGDPRTSQKVKMTDIAATVAIADINQPIDHSLSVTASVNDGPAGTLSVKGKASVIAARRVNIDNATLDETVELKSIDASAIAAFLPPAVVRQLSGQLNGGVIAKVAGGKSIEIRGDIGGKQITFANASFAPGEAYQTDELSILLPLTISLPKGLGDVASAVVRTDGAIGLKTGQVQLSVAVDAPLASLMSAAKNQTVALPGKLNQTLVVDLVPLAAMLPNTIGLKPGSSLSGGRFEQTVTADLSPGQSNVVVTVDVKDIAGEAPIAGAQGQPIKQPFAVEPVSLSINAISRGGGLTAPDVRDLTLNLTSGFATGTVTAPTLASLKGSIDADLAKLKQQLGQFLSLDETPLAGKVNIAADSTGDPTKPSEPAKFSVIVTGTDIDTLVGGKAVKQALVRAGISGTVLRTETGDVKEVRDLSVSAIVGNPTSPTVDVQIAVPAMTYVPPTSAVAAGRYDIPAFTITKVNVALKQAMADFGAFVPAMREYDLSAGALSVSGTGSMVDGAMRFDGAVATTNVDLGRYLALSATGPAARIRQRTEVLAGYSLTANLGATYQPLPDGGAKLTVAKLDVADNRKWLSLRSPGELIVNLPKAGSPQAAGKLALDLDLAQTHDLSRRFMASTKEVIAEASSPDKPVLVKKGLLVATIDLKQNADGSMVLALDGGIDALTVAGNKPVLTDEKLTLAVKASTGPKLASAVLEQLQLKSGLANVDASGQFALSRVVGDTTESVPPLEVVKKMSVKVSTPELAKLQAVAEAFRATNRPAVTFGPEKPEHRGGQTSLPGGQTFLSVTREETRDSNAKGSSAFENYNRSRVTGKNAYPPRGLPIEVAAADEKLPAGTPVPATLPAAAPSMLEQIGEIRISELSASGLGTTLVLKEPLVARSPSELMALFTPPAKAGAATQPVAAAPATTPPATQPTPTPPAKIAGGSATISLDITGDGKTLTIVPVVQTSKLAVTVGTATRDLGDISVKSTLAVATRAPNAAAVAPALAGSFTVAGQIEPLMELSAFLGGNKPQSPYAGAINITQKLATEGAVIKLQGGGTVADFLARDAAGKTTFTEKTIRIDDDLSFDTAGVGTLALSKLGVVFESSGAMSLGVTGKIIDLSRTRTFDNLVADVSYDAEKLWPIIHGMMADPATPADKDPYKDYVIKGKASRRFALGGSLPATDDKGNVIPTAVALRSLIARGSVALDLVEAEGLTIQKLDIPVTLVGGVMKVIDDSKPEGQQKPTPIACNSGTIDLGGIAIDLNGEFPLLNIPANLPLLSKVQLNPALAKSLGDLVNNPLFVPSAETKGIMDVTIVECRDVPLGKMLKVNSRENKGYAVATFSFSGAQFKNTTVTDLLGYLKVDADSLQGSIRDGKVTYSRGYIGHDMTFVLGERQERTIHLYGRVKMADSTLEPLTMLFSASWFGGDIAKFVPKGVPLSMTGNFSAPRYNFATAVHEALTQNYLSGKPEDIANLIDIFSGKKKSPASPATRGSVGANPGVNPGVAPATKPADKAQDNPFGILGDILGQAARDKEKKEQEKKEKERREKEKRDAKKKQSGDDR
ncbi:AsmA family protein [Humisphaera borealis]|uniref:Uncharacterized protein n=1 Tax=Humisphaera borealis TaxID=2807512 RepID=A0A7M2WTW4_9BACT|nr:hypothetical protein [Humisphaera borealis]QOV88714.1 hypothetical protein IPV69_21155 [Humisphaera borealis]